MLSEVLSRMEGFALSGTPEWLPSNFISGPKRMDVRFKPGRRAG